MLGPLQALRFQRPTSLSNTAYLLAGLVAPPVVGAQFATSVAEGDSVPPSAVMPLSVDDVLNLRRLAFGMPVVLSPDGQWVAYTVRNPRRLRLVEGRQAPYFTPSGVSGYATGSELWVMNTGTRESHDLTGQRGISWSGSWSPDGRSLAFYSDRDGVPRIWVWDVLSKITRRVSGVTVRPFEGADLMRWTPDGRQLVVKLPAQASKTEPTTGRSATIEALDGRDGTVQVYRADSAMDDFSYSGRAAQSEWLVVNLALVAVATGKVRQLVRSVPVAAYFMSPDGKAVAFTVVKGPDGVGSPDNRNDIAVVTLDNGNVKTLVSNVPQTENGLAVSWSPDGTTLAYTTNTVSKTISEDCFVVSLSGGPPVNVTPGPHPPISDYGRGPLWDPGSEVLYLLGGNAIWRATTDGRAPTPIATLPQRELLSIVAPETGRQIWSPDGARSLYVRTRDPKTGQAGFARADLGTDRTNLIFEEPAAGHIESYSRFSVDAQGSTIVYSVQRADSPEDLWIANGELENRRRLTAMNPALDHYTFGRSRLVEWLGLDGDSLRGALLLPARYVPGRRYPLVVWLYGGSGLSENLNRFGLEPDVYNLQLLATRGYAVLTPDAPLHAATPMQDLAKTVLPGVNKVIELGIGDPGRLGVAGHSYGGYSTLALIVQTPRFRAAVDIAGVSSLFTLYGQLSDRGFSRGVGWAERGQGRMEASPWERRDRYVENSPFFYLDRLATPLLLLHGTLDHAVPTAASEEIFTALRRLHKEVVYAKYIGAGHTLNQSGLLQQRDFYTRIIDWFGSHLDTADTTDTAPEPQGPTRGQSSKLN